MNDRIETIKTQYKNLLDKLNKYWRIHGGFKQLLFSPYFHIALVGAFIITCFGDGSSFDWQQITLQIIPNLLGFTLAGFAILLSFGDREFLSLLFKDISINQEVKDEPYSYFDKFSTAFLHFILMQGLVLLLALITQSIHCNSNGLANFLNFFGILLLLYAVSLSIATALAIYQTMNLFKTFISKQTPPQTTEQQENKKD